MWGLEDESGAWLDCAGFMGFVIDFVDVIDEVTELSVVTIEAEADVVVENERNVELRPYYTVSRPLILWGAVKNSEA